MKSLLGAGLVEVLVAMALLAIQAPLVVSTVAVAADLTRQADAVVAAITPEASLALCETP